VLDADLHVEPDAQRLLEAHGSSDVRFSAASV